MPLLRSSGELLLGQLLAGQAVPRLQQQFLVDVGYRASIAEVRSWQSSLPVLTGDLRDAGLEQVEVLIEHKMPLASKRADAVLCGRHPRTGEPSFVVVELKQWSRARAFPEDDELVLVDAYGDNPVLHPGRQVQNYVDYMVDFVRALREREELVRGAAYLHNASESGIRDLRRRSESENSRLFTAEQRMRGGGGELAVQSSAVHSATSPGMPRCLLARCSCCRMFCVSQGLRRNDRSET